MVLTNMIANLRNMIFKLRSTRSTNIDFNVYKYFRDGFSIYVHEGLTSS